MVSSNCIKRYRSQYIDSAHKLACSCTHHQIYSHNKFEQKVSNLIIVFVVEEIYINRTELKICI